MSPGRKAFFYGYVIVIAALFISMMMWGTRQTFGVFFEPVLDEFGWTRAMTSGGFSAAWVLTGILSIVVGRLNDRFGPRLVMTVAGVLVAAGFMLMYLLNSIWQLYLFYGVICVGMAGALVPLMSTVARWFVKKRASMSGVVLSSTGISLVFLVPAISQLIVSHGWRMSYLIYGISALVVIVTASQFLKPDPYRAGLLPDGQNEANSLPVKPKADGLSFREGLRTRQLWFMSGVYFCTYFIFYIFLVHLVIYATGQGIPLTQAVTIMSMIGVGGIAGRLLWGVVGDRAGNRRALLFSSALMLVALLWLLVAKDLWMLFLFGVIFGLGHGGIATIESPLVAQLFGMRSHGVLLGFVFFADTVGGAISPIVAGYIFDVRGSYYLAFVLAAAIGVINCILVYLIKPLKSKN